MKWEEVTSQGKLEIAFHIHILKMADCPHTYFDTFTAYLEFLIKNFKD